MPSESERRGGPDRRSEPRGGRRPTDQSGFTPLVLVVNEDSRVREVCEVILAKLRFAVTPATSVEEAIKVVAALRPEVIVARPRDIEALRAHTSRTEQGAAIPIVATDDGDTDAAARFDMSGLIDAIRRALRAARAART